LPDEDFGKRDHDNPSQQQKTADTPQKNRETFFKSMIGDIKIALDLEDKLDLQPKPQKMKGVHQTQ
jgi:hypothetical protein